MIHPPAQSKRVLAVAFNMRGFGFALLDAGALTDWGIKNFASRQGVSMLAEVEGLISLYAPDVVVSEDLRLSPFRHSARIRSLNAALKKLTARIGVENGALALGEAKKCLFATGLGTKHQMAQVLAQRFPEELGHMLPEKRLPYTTEHYRMGIFDAVAIAVAYNLSRS